MTNVDNTEKLRKDIEELKALLREEIPAHAKEAFSDMLRKAFFM